MTMHLVLGDGEMDRRELTQTLDDMWAAAEADEEQFWFVVQGKPEPTATDTALVNWLSKNEVYFEVVTDDEDTPTDLYEGAAKVHTTKRLSQKVISLLKTGPEGDEGAKLLALFSDPADVDAEEDRWLNGVLNDAVAADFPCYALNDAMNQIEVGGEAPAAATPTPSKSATKKAAAAAREVVEKMAVYTEEDLAELTVDELKPIAARLDINLPPRTRAGTYIAAILEAQSVPEEEAEEVLEEEIEAEAEFSTVERNGMALVVVHLPEGMLVRQVPTDDIMALLS